MNIMAEYMERCAKICAIGTILRNAIDFSGDNYVRELSGKTAELFGKLSRDFDLLEEELMRLQRSCLEAVCGKDFDE